jgi:hypothetical protein
MTMRSRLLVLASITALTAAAVTVATPASAAPSPEQRMLTEKDVPASFGTPKSREFVAKAEDKDIVACQDATGKVLVSTPAPSTQYSVTIETKNKKTYTEVNEKVYVFDTAKQATDAFNQLFNNLSKCTGTSTLKQTPAITDTLTSGSYPGGQYADLWVNDNSVARGGECKKPCRSVVQTVFVQAGTSIVQTWAYINGKGQLTGKQSNDLADLAEELGARWAS